MKIVAVYNPTSRVPRSEIERLFGIHAADWPLTIIETAAGEPISSRIAPELLQTSVVVAIGGDGTVSSTAAALIDTGVPLGIVPAGTTNMLAKVNRVPATAEGAIRLITGEHRIELVDAGICGDRVLLHLGGAGLDARIFERSSSSLKRRLQWLGYLPPAIRGVRDRGSDVAVTVDGATVNVHSRMVLIANTGAVIHPGFTVVPTQSRSDGLFEVAIFTANSMLEVGQTLSDLTIMRWRSSPRVIQLRGREIQIEASPAMPFEFDGDVIGKTPFAISVRQRAIAMICGLQASSDNGV
ncbi:MAG: diacylglycerol kinase family protein [Thermomicrobiales bacterium]